jgi:hypothetical protein
MVKSFSQKAISIISLTALLLVALALVSARVLAANTPNFTQLLNAGVLATDILDASRVPVGSPSVAFSAKTFSFDCQSGGNASTGTLGTGTQRVYVMNPDAADNGWTLSIAATGGATSVWDAGAATDYDFNDPTSSGCTDGADGDSFGGQMTIDPSVSTLTADCVSCVTTNVTKGSSSSYNQGTTDSVTLLNAAAASDDTWRGYMTGAAASQTLPAEQVAGSYSIGMTLTVVAN